MSSRNQRTPTKLALPLLLHISWSLIFVWQVCGDDSRVPVTDHFLPSAVARCIGETEDEFAIKVSDELLNKSRDETFPESRAGFLNIPTLEEHLARLSGLYVFHGYGSWRGVSDGTGPNNNGLVYGANYGMPLGAVGEATGLGLQVGASYGLYDFMGRSSGYRDEQMQQQVFITAGLFRNADEFSRLSFGIVYDISVNSNFGQYAANPLLTQARGQIAYRLNEKHELGVWASVHATQDTVYVDGPLTFRAVDQINVFWHHKFDWGADGWTSFGIPDSSRLNGQGSLGSYQFGANLLIPVGPKWAAYADLQYMVPSARAGAAGASEDSFYIGFGIMFYPGSNSRSQTMSAKSWLPWLPVANNGSFIVDSNRSF